MCLMASPLWSLSLRSSEPPFLAGRASEILVGLTAADGYKKMLSHLGPDPKVGVQSLNYHRAKMMFPTLGGRLVLSDVRPKAVL
jgi:hypothetical protein